MWLSSFNKSITVEEWNLEIIPAWCRFEPTNFIVTQNMTQKEKEENPTHITTWGYLKTYTYKEAFKKSYDKATRAQQLKIKNVIHFDAEIFYEISGIRIDDDDAEEMTI